MNALENMRGAALERKIAQASLDRAMNNVREAVREAAQAGYPIATISREAGVSRQTVYTILEEEA